MHKSQETSGNSQLKFDRLYSVNQYEQIESIIQRLGDHFKDQPSLEELARKVGMSPEHFQRVFKKWVGISPKQFLKYLTLEYAKSRLEQDKSVLDSALDSGLSGPGRLHDLFVTLESITPGEYKQGGGGLGIEYGIHPSQFGFAVLAVCDRGLCGSFFLPSPNDRLAEEAIVEYWPQARFTRDDSKTSIYAKQLFDTSYKGNNSLSLFVRGTPFQVQVWRALLEIPSGSLRTYSDLASSVDRPTATRAVASSVGDNPISWFIPCHRVIRKGGYLGGYRWGLPRKKVMLAWEANRRKESLSGNG
ncbi:methylated-DNA--[protein]-cysteine S-methyltransferase [Opitutales bacterium]|nr:methylated-DNA--[protein]-cysteine S-methyltransferase [Opitutales bacterium]